MRIAILADIHGNSIALDAVLADIEAQGGVTAHWVLGDLAAIGYDPVGVLGRLTQLAKVRIVRGNTDRYVATGARPEPTLEMVRSNPELLPTFAEVRQTFAWTQGALAAAGWLDWLARLPLECRLILPDGARLLGVHASPGNDDGTGFRPDLSEAEMAGLLAGCEADLVCVGHTHCPMNFRLKGIHLVNVGSVSNPIPPDLRASYAILEATESGYRIEQRRVDYDHAAVIAAIERVRHPSGDYIIRFMRGEIRPGWE